jgi:hypothetical protein
MPSASSGSSRAIRLRTAQVPAIGPEGLNGPDPAAELSEPGHQQFLKRL